VGFCSCNLFSFKRKNSVLFWVDISVVLAVSCCLVSDVIYFSHGTRHVFWLFASLPCIEWVHCQLVQIYCWRLTVTSWVAECSRRKVQRRQRTCRWWMSKHVSMNTNKWVMSDWHRLYRYCCWYFGFDLTGLLVWSSSRLGWSQEWTFGNCWTVQTRCLFYHSTNSVKNTEGIFCI